MNQKRKFNFKTILVFVFVLCILAVAYLNFHQDAPPPQAQRQSVRRVPDLVSRPTTLSENTLRTPAQNLQNNNLKTRKEAFAERLQQSDWRAQQKALRKRLPRPDRAEDSVLNGYVEAPDIKAISMTDASLIAGEVIEKKNGFIIYRTMTQGSTLQAFTPHQRPVVFKAGSPILRIVTGDLVVKFRELPDNLDSFARAHRLKIKGEYADIQSAIFTSVLFPVDLLQILDDVKQNENVISAELEILGPQLKRQ